jgi:SAM-dependent methyltransferase
MTAHHAPVLWQDVGRGPRAPLDPILGHVPGDDSAQARLLAERAASGTVGTRAAAGVLAALAPEELHAHAAGDRAPLPGPEDRVHYYGDDHVAYWLSGLADALFLAEVADRHGAPLRTGAQFLDFGCASGRVLRHVERLHPDVGVWGADLSITTLAWAREHLPPRIKLLQATMVPGLPIADGALDLVFAGSVFTHVAEWEETLLAELRRVLRPGGVLLASVHPERAWRNLGSGADEALAGILTGSPHRAEPMGVEPVTLELFRTPMPADRVVIAGTLYPINNLFTFHTRAWLERRWSAHFEIAEIVEHGHGRRQDLVVLR